MRVKIEKRDIKGVLAVNHFIGECQKYAMSFDNAMDIGTKKKTIEEVVEVYNKIRQEVATRLRQEMKEKEGGYADITSLHLQDLNEDANREVENYFDNNDGDEEPNTYEIPVFYFSRDELKTWNNEFGDKDKYKDKAFNPDSVFFTIGADFIVDKHED